MISALLRRLRPFAIAERGQTVLEFGICTSLLTVILVGVTDLSFYIIAAMGVQEAATEGAAYGASPGNQLDTGNMVGWSEQAVFGFTLASTPVATTFYTCSPGGAQVTSATVCTGGAAPMEYVSVTCVANINPIFRSTFIRGGTITDTATYRVAWKTQ